MSDASECDLNDEELAWRRLDEVSELVQIEQAARRDGTAAGAMQVSVQQPAASNIVVLKQGKLKPADSSQDLLATGVVELLTSATGSSCYLRISHFRVPNLVEHELRLYLILGRRAIGPRAKTELRSQIRSHSAAEVPLEEGVDGMLHD